MRTLSAQSLANLSQESRHRLWGACAMTKDVRQHMAVSTNWGSFFWVFL